MGICFDIDLTTTSHTFLQCRFWSRLLVQPLDCQQNHLFISLPLRCRKFQGVPWRASAVSKPTNMGKHVEAADTMKNPWNIWKEPNQIIKSASSGCFMLQVHPNAERHPFVRAGTMYDFLIAHWWQDSFDIFGVSPYFHLKAMWVIQHFQTKKTENSGIEESSDELRKTQWDPEVVTGNAGNAGQQVAPRVEIPTKSLRSKLQGTAMLQHRFQGHLLGDDGHGVTLVTSWPMKNM